jgi:hypothetical protein
MANIDINTVIGVLRLEACDTDVTPLAALGVTPGRGDTLKLMDR